MKHILSCIALLGVVASVQGATVTVDVPVNQLIPDGDLAGMVSQTTVSGVGANAFALSLSLVTTGTYNGDLVAYMTHDGETAVLLNNAGVTPTDSLGYGDHGFDVTFVDGAPDIHYYRSTLGNPSGVLDPVTGVWGLDSTAGSTTTLDSLLSGGADGVWTLFIADTSGGDLNSLDSWSLNFAVPECGTWGLLSAGLLLGVTTWRARRSKRSAV